MNWLQRIQNWLRPTPIEEISLGYVLDIDKQGHHLVRIYRHENGKDMPVADIKDLLRYDYREITGDGKKLYVVGREDRDILLAISSLNPQFVNHFTLAVDATPPILSYLRKKSRLVETPDAKAIQVSSVPLKPVAQVNFEPQRGLEIKAGYQVDATGPLIAASDVRSMTRSDFVRIGNLLAPLEKPESSIAQELLHREKTVVPIDQIPEYFTRDLVLIQQEFNAVLNDMAKRIRLIDGNIQPTVSVNKTTPGWLDFNIEYTVGDQKISHMQLMVNSHNPYSRISPTTWVRSDRKMLSDVQKKLQDLGTQDNIDALSGGYRVPISQFASLEEFIDAIGGLRSLSAAYQIFLAQLTNFKADASFRLAAPIEQELNRHRITLRSYQREGIHWLIWLFQNRLHGLLADDMGLGKTMQTVCAMAHAYISDNVQQHSLIIAPKSVLVHWYREISRCVPQIRVAIYHGPNRSSTRPLFTYTQPTIFISTYATVTNDIDYLVQIPFFYVILDEATNIKNPNARRTQGIKTLNAAHRIALSGTPIENRPSELWSLFDFLMRDHLGRYGTFQRVFETPILAGNQQVSERLGKRIRPFMLRRRKDEVAKDLPEKIPIVTWCELTDEQRDLYGALQASANEITEALRKGENVSYTGAILPVLTKLKQICDHPALITGQKQPAINRSEKFDLIMEKIKEIVSQGEQVVVFSHFLGMLDLLQHEFDTANINISYIRIDGGTNNRQQLVDSFNRGESTVALCSLMAAGQGITLTAANHVIHADRWWNPAVENQATDRVHRIGQTKTVFVYHFLTQGTLEETIDELLERKQMMADHVVDAAENKQLQWTKEELIEILKPLRD